MYNIVNILSKELISSDVNFYLVGPSGRPFVFMNILQSLDHIDAIFPFF